MIKLQVTGSAQEELLFRLIGVDKAEADTVAGLLVGQAHSLSDLDPRLLYLALPDPGQPMKETERLARMLGRAIGMGEVHL